LDNVTARVVQALQEDCLTPAGGLMEAVVVVGAANPHRRQLEDLTTAAGGSIRLVRDPPDMAELMEWADVAVSAAGSTCWEMAFLGLPALLLVTAENQEPVAAGVGAAGAAIDLGWHHTVSPVGLARALSALCRDPVLRAAQSRAGQRLVDGRGADRVVDAMLNAGSAGADGRLRLRRAEPGDGEALWRLMNQLPAREHVLRPEPLSLDSHLVWFARKLASPVCQIWVMESGTDVIALIRYDRTSPDVAEVSFAVSPAWRGRGVGARLLAQTTCSARIALYVHDIQGVVLGTDVSPTESFLKAGFVEREPQLVEGRHSRVFSLSC
jgi:N-acetylglutamate synthase-like GNAT family acetyltransferase